MQIIIFKISLTDLQLSLNIKNTLAKTQQFVLTYTHLKLKNTK